MHNKLLELSMNNLADEDGDIFTYSTWGICQEIK